MFGVSLGQLAGLMIGTVKVSLVGLSMGLPFVSPLDSPNPGLTGVILDMTLVNPLLSLLDSIWNINWRGPWIGTWKFL